MPIRKRDVRNCSAAVGGLYESGPMAGQTPPPRTKTADSGYFDNGSDDEVVQRPSIRVLQRPTSSHTRGTHHAQAVEID
jgi:hypothetical protein